MASIRALGRARSDIDVVSRAGLPLHAFMTEASASLGSVVPFVAGCVSTLDPQTAMVSGTVKLEALSGRNDADVAWARIEYGEDDPTAMQALLLSGRTAIGVSQETEGLVERSVRMAQLLIPYFGFYDEARVVFTDRAGAWGCLAIFRGSDDGAFSHDELDFLASVAPAFTRGIRTGLLAQPSPRTQPVDMGPAVVIVDANDRIVQSSERARQLYERMAALPGWADPLHMVQALVSGARRQARGETDQQPRIRMRTIDGVWVVLHAALLSGDADRAGEVIVTIDEARPQEIADIVAGAFALTSRESEVMALVLRGADTKQMADALHVSAYTVQDHLKSIFDKSGVTSRHELVARVYFDHHLPRLESGLDIRA